MILNSHYDDADRLNALFTFLRSTPMPRRPDRGAGRLRRRLHRGLFLQLLRRAVEAWATTHAFLEPGEHARFTAYDPEVPIEWRNGVPAPRAYWEAVSGDSSLPWG